ncbi:MAG: GNAT family N-acetyltransferase [Alphaproteobacteria bacterium]|nr:GNAT family N-acetyltransferase [Alphaproteobacteria bacterium]MCB9691946.1 GNAT family N-acetyltransferase [Alphaproteobacteria bacterium]
MIRVARPGDLAVLGPVEHDAATRYAEIGLPGDFACLPLTCLEEGARAGLLFVLDLEGPAGFALCQAYADGLHLRELDVVRAHQGRGHGTLLLDRVAREALDRGLPRVTLTTFRDVPFNAPWYVSRGFRVLEPTGWLAAIRAEEREAGLDAWPRVAMERVLAG